MEELIKLSSAPWGGIGAAVALTALLLAAYYVVKGGKGLSVISYLIALILVPMLSFQMSRLIGAIDVKSGVENAIDEVNAALDFYGTDLSQETVYSAVLGFLDFMPELTPYVNIENIGDVNLDDFAESMMHDAKSYLNKYIAFRVFWSVCFVGLALIGLNVFSYDSNSRRRPSSRKEPIVSRRYSEGGRHRYSRR